MKINKLFSVVCGSVLALNYAMADVSSCLVTVQQNATLAEQYMFTYPIGSPGFEGFFHMYQLYVMAQEGVSGGCLNGMCQFTAPVGCALSSSTQEPYITLWDNFISPALNTENAYMANKQYDPNLVNGLPNLVCTYPQGNNINPQDCSIQYLH